MNDIIYSLAESVDIYFKNLTLSPERRARVSYHILNSSVLFIWKHSVEGWELWGETDERTDDQLG
jgi:ABC-type amino acid transport substrate-binding protein